MKIVFFGTPNYVEPVLKALSKNYEISAVVTQPPRPVGRKKIREFSPVDHWAHKRKVKIYFDPQKVVDDGVEADFAVLAAYGQILPESILKYFKYGILNIHPSLLPNWRGTSPVQASIISGDIAGSTVIKLDSKMDHGPIISQFKEEILDKDTGDTLRDKLFERSADFLIDLIPNYINGKINLKIQDESKATYTKLLKKEDGHIDLDILKDCIEKGSSDKKLVMRFMNGFELSATSENVERFIRAMQNWPGAWTEVKTEKEGKNMRLKILSAKVENKKLVLKEVQLESKNLVSWEEFISGYPNNSLI